MMLLRALIKRIATTADNPDERGMLGSQYGALLGFASMAILMVLSFATQAVVAMTLSVLPG